MMMCNLNVCMHLLFVDRSRQESVALFGYYYGLID